MYSSNNEDYYERGLKHVLFCFKNKNRIGNWYKKKSEY